MKKKSITSVAPFGSFSPADYAALGFRGGLEIHQQLLTSSKLFCRCPAGRYSDRYDAEILRHMRPTLSEMGEYDGTALMEFKTRKNIIYRTKQETCCTYDMDDTPPFDMDAEAIVKGLKVAILLNCNIVSEIHIMRKQYLDGSIPTGFQRTAILGVDGYIPFAGRRVSVKQLSLEEDSCREVADVGHKRTYLTDRLGMPLIETVTYPDMTTPDEIAAVGQLLRRLARGSGLVRTGIGAARQDVNVSVTGGTRVEIKGVPRLVQIPRLTHNEAMRQRALLDIRAELKRRGVTARSFKAVTRDVTAVFRNTSTPPGNAAGQGGSVYAALLKGYAGILAAPTQETRRFVDEISGRVRVVACLDVLPNIFDDDTSKRELDAAVWRKLRKQLEAGPSDVTVLIWGPDADARLGAGEVILRAREATQGVPSETRQALADGTNGFERILPGPDRMYPDTDRPPILIEKKLVERARAEAGEPTYVREERYRDWAIPEDCVGGLATSPWGDVLDSLVAQYNAPPKFAATLIMHRIKGWNRRGLGAEKITLADMERAFGLLRQGKVLPEAVPLALRLYVEQDRPLRQVLQELTHRTAAEAALPDAAAALRRSMKRKTFPNGPEARRRYAMGQLMARFRGLVPASRLVKVVENLTPDAAEE